MAQKSHNKGRLKIDHAFTAVKKIETTFVRVIRTTHEGKDKRNDDNGLSKLAARFEVRFVPGDYDTQATKKWFEKNTMRTIVKV